MNIALTTDMNRHFVTNGYIDNQARRYFEIALSRKNWITFYAMRIDSIRVRFNTRVSRNKATLWRKALLEAYHRVHVDMNVEEVGVGRCIRQAI